MPRLKRKVEKIINKSGLLANWTPLKPKPRPENKFYIKDRYGTEMLAFEFQSVATVMYPVGTYSKQQVNDAFDELRKLRETLNV